MINAKKLSKPENMHINDVNCAFKSSKNNELNALKYMLSLCKLLMTSKSVMLGPLLEKKIDHAYAPWEAIDYVIVT